MTSTVRGRLFQRFKLTVFPFQDCRHSSSRTTLTGFTDNTRQLCAVGSIRYDTIEEFNVDSKVEYSALSSTRSQKKKLKQRQCPFNTVQVKNREISPVCRPDHTPYCSETVCPSVCRSHCGMTGIHENRLTIKQKPLLHSRFSPTE